MKQVVPFVFLVSILFGCNKSKNDRSDQLYKGELFIKLITLGSDFYTLEDENGISLYDKYSSIQDTSLLNTQEKAFKKYFDLLNENDLIGKPYFQFKSSAFEVKYKTVFLSEQEYEHIKDFNLSMLNKNKQKVLIEFYGQEFLENAIKCNQIKLVKVVRGKTEWAK